MAVHSIAIPNVIEASEYIANEVPTGLINSSNTTFTLAQTPIPDSLSVFLNGLLQVQGASEDYTVSGNTITFIKAPRTNSHLIAIYVYNS